LPRIGEDGPSICSVGDRRRGTERKKEKGGEKKKKKDSCAIARMCIPLGATDLWREQGGEGGKERRKKKQKKKKKKEKGNTHTAGTWNYLFSLHSDRGDIESLVKGKMKHKYEGRKPPTLLTNFSIVSTFNQEGKEKKETEKVPFPATFLSFLSFS